MRKATSGRVTKGAIHAANMRMNDDQHQQSLGKHKSRAQWEGGPQNGRNDWHFMYLIATWCLKYVRNRYNSRLKRYLHLKLGKTAGWEGSLGESGTCICMDESLCCAPETITTLFISYTPIQNSKFNFKKWKLRGGGDAKDLNRYFSKEATQMTNKHKRRCKNHQSSGKWKIKTTM